MADKEHKEPSYGKIMTSLLIPKDSRSNPKRLLSGVAFLAFVCFFLVAALSRGCQQDTTIAPQEQSQIHTVQVWRA